MRLGSMPGIWLINEGLIPFRIRFANSGGAAEVPKRGLWGVRFNEASVLPVIRPEPRSLHLSAQNARFRHALEWADTCKKIREYRRHLIIVIRRILRKMGPRYANRNAAIGDYATTIPNYVLSRTLCRRESAASPALYELFLLRIVVSACPLLLESISILSGLQIRSDNRQIRGIRSALVASVRDLECEYCLFT
jgi:hypothetical protein